MLRFSEGSGATARSCSGCCRKSVCCRFKKPPGIQLVKPKQCMKQATKLRRAASWACSSGLDGGAEEQACAQDS